MAVHPGANLRVSREASKREALQPKAGCSSINPPEVNLGLCAESPHRGVQLFLGAEWEWVLFPGITGTTHR